MSMHAAAWSVTATGVAMTTAVASKHYRGLPRLLIAAVLAGLTSAMLFVPLATILFPLQNSDMLVPAEFTGRLLFVSLAGMLMGLAAASSPFLTETGGHRAGTRQGGP
jgi:hypothetical protein